MRNDLYSIFNSSDFNQTHQRALETHIGWSSRNGCLHHQILDCVENPEIVYQGNKDEFIAVKPLDNEKLKFVVVVYKESDDNDGFIITSFITNKLAYLHNKQVLWKQQK